MSIPGREDNVVSTMERFHAEFVPVMFVDDREEAEHYRALLESHDIPALVDDRAPGEVYYSDLPRAVPLLVPEPLLDAASELVRRDEREEAQLPSMAARSADDEEEADDFDDDDDDELDDFDDDDEDDLDEADDFDDDDEDEFEEEEK